MGSSVESRFFGQVAWLIVTFVFAILGTYGSPWMHFLVGFSGFMFVLGAAGWCLCAAPLVDRRHVLQPHRHARARSHLRLLVLPLARGCRRDRPFGGGDLLEQLDPRLTSRTANSWKSLVWSQKPTGLF